MTSEEMVKFNFGNKLVVLPIYPIEKHKDDPPNTNTINIQDSEGAVIMEGLHSWERAWDLCKHINTKRAEEVEANENTPVAR